MRIGILTFHRALNYGAVLQAYALINYLKSIGHDVEVIDYWPTGHAKAYALFNKDSLKNKSIFVKLKILLYVLFRFKRAKKRKKKMEDLQKKFFEITDFPKYKSSEDLKNVNYDIVVYGSDQIWWKSSFPTYLGYDYVYWGDFIPNSCKKITYSASMGKIDLSNSDLSTIQNKLKSFSSIAVREKKLADILQRYTTTHINQTIDPVFLISKDKWNALCNHVFYKRKYVLLFNLMHSPAASKYAKKISKEHNLDIIEITSLVEPFKFAKNILQELDAIEFISYVKNAQYVVTSSFHGTAFSIIFEKQFISVGMKNNAERVKSLLSILNLSSNYQDDYSEQEINQINYSIVNELLAREINKSKKYLFEGINE